MNKEGGQTDRPASGIKRIEGSGKAVTVVCKSERDAEILRTELSARFRRANRPGADDNAGTGVEHE